MGTQPLVPAPVKAVTLAAVLLAACGGSNPTANRTPSSPAVSPSAATSPAARPSAASPSPTTAPIAGAYGVLVSTQTASTYTVSIVAVDGSVVASAQAATPPSPSCGMAAGLVPLPVSTSNRRLYYMDAGGNVSWLSPDGSKSQGPVATLPAPTASRRSMFAVSPDDAEMAVVVASFNSSGATTQLYMYELSAGGTQKLLYTQTGSYTLWPVGWRTSLNLVLGKIAACTQGGGPLVDNPIELHVVDPVTANRRFTLGGSACHVAGQATPAGVVCEDTGGFTSASEVNWTAGVFGTFPIQGPTPAFISPDGTFIAVVNYAGGVTNVRVAVTMNMLACEWIDSSHLLAGGDAQQQPRVGDVTTSKVVPVPAQGDCGGRIPGGL